MGVRSNHSATAGQWRTMPAGAVDLMWYLAGVDALRVDKWLWTARFFRHRPLATEAVRGGRVQVNGARVRPSREVRQGDLVRITLDDGRIEVEVQGLDERRGPASQARELYAETPRSVAMREHEREQQHLARQAVPRPQRRPDRRQRRALIRNKQGEDSGTP